MRIGYTRQLAPVYLLLAVLISILSIALFQSFAGHASVLRSFQNWIVFSASDDSWTPMREAYTWFASPHSGTIYQEIVTVRHVKFQYPPSSLLVFAFPEAWGVTVSDTWLNLCSWLSVVVTATSSAALFWIASQQGIEETKDLRTRVAGTVIAGCVTLIFYPVLRAFELGQIQAWLNAMFALSVLAFFGGKKRWCGALVGGICLIKPQFGLFLIWALLRRQWDFGGTMALVLAIGFGTSLLWFGWDNHIEYLNAVSYMGRHGEALYANQSVNGLVQRWLGIGSPLKWQGSAYSPYHPTVYYITIVTSLMIVGFAFAWRRKGDLPDFLVAALAFTMASPIAWEHHYGILPPILTLLVCAILLHSDAGRANAWALLLACVYVAAASFFAPHENHWMRTAFYLPLSYMFFCGLTVMFLLCRFADDVLALVTSAGRASVRSGAFSNRSRAWHE